MASSPTEIANLALGHLGERRIVSLDEDSTAARACNLHYGHVRDGLLRAHRWNFAQTRATLTALSEEPAFGWDYQYPLPNDCLRVLELNDSEFNDLLTDQYVIEGGNLLTDSDSVNIVYVSRVEDVRKFDPLFVEAFALKLAIVLSETIRGTTSKTEQLAKMFEQVTGPLARRIDGNEGRRRKGLIPMSSEFVRARSVGL